MVVDSKDLTAIVEKVIKEMNGQQNGAVKNKAGNLGVFIEMDDAIEAAKEAQKEFQANYTMDDREDIIDAMRKHISEYVRELSELAVEESGMGRVEDKILKNKLAIEGTPGTEDLRTEAISGSDGLTVIEEAPFGVICSIAPVTNPTETIICNSIGMLAAGNSVVFNPHPEGKDVSLKTVQLLNEAICNAGGPANLLTAVEEPTLQTVEACMHDERIAMISATGGPGVVNAALSSGKKAIGAGAGNPPVIVDTTADIQQAAVDIINGASLDNNLPCTSEKVIIAVEEIADELIECMINDRAQLVKDPTPLEKVVLNNNGSINKAMVGKDAAYILRQAGLEPKDDELRIVVVEVEKEHLFVQEEQLMPVIPLVRVKDFDRAVEVGVEVEHGNRHTAMIHSKNVDNMTAFARAIETTIFVKNAPSYAGIGFGGEGHPTFTIAGPTGEGLTSPRSFTRRRRCVLVDGLSII